MKKVGLFLSLLLAGAVAVPAQGPPEGGWGRGRGMGGPGGPGGPGEMFGLMAAGPASRTPVTGAPYAGSETSQIVEKLADGNVITRTNQAKVYRDKDGRVRIEHTFAPPGATARSPRSCPAQKPRPAPVITSTRASPPASSPSAERTSACIAVLKLFRRSGRLRVSRATPSLIAKMMF